MEVSGSDSNHLSAYCYLRLSTEARAGNAPMLDAQRDVVHAYAKEQGIQIVETFVDMGVSGIGGCRPEFRRMFEQATSDARPVDLVLVAESSRIARSIPMLSAVVSDLENAGVQVRAIAENWG